MRKKIGNKHGCYQPVAKLFLVITLLLPVTLLPIIFFSFKEEEEEISI